MRFEGYLKCPHQWVPRTAVLANIFVKLVPIAVGVFSYERLHNIRVSIFHTLLFPYAMAYLVRWISPD